jgi:hypothetical protein
LPTVRTEVTSLDVPDQAVGNGNPSVGFIQIANQIADANSRNHQPVESSSKASATYWVNTSGWDRISLAMDP